MLGRSIVKQLASQASDFTVSGVSRSLKIQHPGLVQYNVDLSNLLAVGNLLETVKPDIIIHTAALTNLNYCETNKEEAHQVHVMLTQKLAQYKQAKLIYISTDSVFDGVNGNYDEHAITYPLNYYALSKLQGESAVLYSNPEALVLRTNIYGFKTPAGHSLGEWAIKSLLEKKTITGYSDIYFNPMYVGQVAGLLPRLMNQHGILNLGCSENLSKFAFLRALAEVFEMNPEQVSETISPQDTSLRRPKNTTLNIEKLAKLINERPGIYKGLEMFKSEFLQTYAN